MATECQLDLVGGDAITVVGDQDAVGATAFDLHPDVQRTGVQRVFYELFDHRRGSLDDLARGDLGRQVRVHHPNGASHHSAPGGGSPGSVDASAATAASRG